MALFTESADVSVRPAIPGDDAAVADIQVAAWRASHATLLGEDALESLDGERIRRQWEAAITAPPGPGYAVLVACERADVVGFAAVGPAVLVALEVAPSAQRSGHGSRLLSAAVDRLRSDGASEMSTWVLDDDPAREQFFTGAGLGPDGKTRLLATGVREVRETRWSATI
ncbi:GNAT family N-acetyltransferase [Sanguibacter antarcticus]|uniref:L-amino acid N-acyltransferase YncA n=1 Tax=Sanguibacter antarcticus TaxID=372484 RepID=A0A2A9E4P3_9MICO|nr:GNAT family N-acetyltransferase [Sanguibacter antarcticus]PFG33521.1 L-amino acid N-acyltransferase YncA [Sanguibacter antarcticus]